MGKREKQHVPFSTLLIYNDVFCNYETCRDLSKEGTTLSNIAIIDDDLAVVILRDALHYRGHSAFRIGSADEALASLDRIVSADLIILDIIMAWPDDQPTAELGGAQTAGMEVLRKIRLLNPSVPIIAYSATQDAMIIDALRADTHTVFISKWDMPSLHEFIRRIYQFLGDHESPTLQSFIVHGTNETEKYSLKNYLQNILHLPEPIILHEKPNMGRTIIEKFEDYASVASIVFVLLTPDDIGASGEETDDQKRRARQNVIFEMGYLLGVLGRKSGRVILLYKNPLELPSDIAGVVYIDISHGIEAAGEKIRREVENVQF